jgi:anti-sigma B factor antagonist
MVAAKKSYDDLPGIELMEIDIEHVNEVAVVGLFGRFDSNTAHKVQQTTLPLAKAGHKILLDMTNVNYMSSAGLRTLLTLYRTVREQHGAIALAGLNEELTDVMSITGFIDFFNKADDRKTGINLLSGQKQ